MAPEKDVSKVEGEALRISKGITFCVATVIGKYTSFPDVDEPTFSRVHQKITAGLLFHRRNSIGDFCQELRGVIACPVSELLHPERVTDADGNDDHLDETELRLIAIADVVRRNANISDALFRELLTGLLSWDANDRVIILDTLINIVRGL